MIQEDVIYQGALLGDALYAAVFIDGCDAGIPIGEIASAYLPVPIPFRGAGELMLTLDEWYRYLNPHGMPQRPHFFKAPGLPKKAGPPRRYYRCLPTLRRGKRPLLLVVVKTRMLRNGSWQGSLHWPDARQELRFSSALECMGLLLEAFVMVVHSKGPGAAAPLRQDASPIDKRAPAPR